MSVLEDSKSSDLRKAIDSPTDFSRIVPKHKNAGFTGFSEIMVRIDFSDHDETLNTVRKIITDADLKIVGDIDPVIDISKLINFEDSSFKSVRTTWAFLPKVVQSKSRKQTPVQLHRKNDKVWQSCIAEFKKLLPQVIYFPTFLVDMPKRIYLEGNHDIIDSHYRQIIADVMNGLSTPLNLKTHIIDRAHKYKTAATGYSSSLRSSNEGARINDTVQAIAAELNRVVFGAWHEIFEKPVKDRSIVIEWHIDEKQDNHIYLELYILAGNHRYSLSERSLGFRWFFSFLLFSQFQRNRADKKKIVFLFDEPASHLHPKAQERLLRSFAKIADPNHIIIYSTHSHYLLNPLWLEKTYVVSNSAIDDSSDSTGISSIDSKVTISATPYKSFVSNNPGKSTYYQPILDALDYSSHGLDIQSPLVILEGKYDYYPFMYFVNKLGYGDTIRIIPSVGAGGMSALIGILKAWFVKFVIILDDDAAGRKEKGKYKNDLLLSNNQVITLDDIDPSYSDMEFDDLFANDVKDAAKDAGYHKQNKVDKEHIYSYFLDLMSDPLDLSSFVDTEKNFDNVLKAVVQRIEAQ